MVLLDQNAATRFTYLEYQALIVSLAGMMCAVMTMMEVAMSRFMVLPLLFPGMFAVRQRRFYVYNLDISDGWTGRQIRSEAKMVMRMTICVVMAYLWHFCVMETTQVAGTEFPHSECDNNFDCFASEMHFITFFNRQHTAIDCKGARQDFADTLVVSCIHFVPPSATEWLKHLAIAHSVTQLNLKSYEILVWVAGTSPKIRQCIAFVMVGTVITLTISFFAGALATFVNSWLSFVMTLATPFFMLTVWRSGYALQVVYAESQDREHTTIEDHLDQAFADIEAVVKDEADQAAPVRQLSKNRVPSIAGRSNAGWGSGNLLTNALSFVARAVLSRTNSDRSSRRGDGESTPQGTPSGRPPESDRSGVETPPTLDVPERGLSDVHL